MTTPDKQIRALNSALDELRKRTKQRDEVIAACRAASAILISAVNDGRREKEAI